MQGILIAVFKYPPLPNPVFTHSSFNGTLEKNIDDASISLLYVFVDGDTIATLVGVGFIFVCFIGWLYKAFKSYPCCPFCREIIDANAKRCPHCTSQLHTENPPALKKPRKQESGEIEFGSLERAMRLVKKDAERRSQNKGSSS